MHGVDVPDAPQTPSDADAPKVPGLGVCRSGTPSVIHSLGDLHGWAPSLITYLITNKLADISIDGRPLGSGGEVDSEVMEAFFGLSRKYPEAGLRGMPGCEDAINGDGHGSIKARWIANEDTAFVQIGDIFDRADHSELAAEIVRQLIIEAPNRVFAIVGNHEQFMLENAVDNWYLNESRNAITDPSEFPENSSRKHTRFIPDISALPPEERAIKHIFPCYRLSTFTLFLTQAAAQQKSGFINRKMEDGLVEALLSDGWGAYSAARSYIDDIIENPVEHIPGATVALVIGENLFHHAEPGSHLNGLPDMLTSHEGGFGWFDYALSGSIQGSPHSEFLWSRGSSNGANNGSPKVAGEIDSLRESWPGLFRIVHGHSPTVSTDEFTKAMHRGIESSSCSYLAQNSSDTPARGKAYGIRVYNIDEGTSPVYYQGSQEPDSPNRVPMGLRLCVDQEKDDRVVVHTHDDPLLEAMDESVLIDTRKLWSWEKGQFRITGKDKWPLNGVAISKSDFDSCVIEFDDSIWIVRANTAGIDLLSRRLNGVPILINLMRSLIRDIGIDWKDPDKTTPALGHMQNDVFKDLIKKHLIPKYQGCWEVAEQIGLSAVGLKLGNDGMAQVISLCGSVPEKGNLRYEITKGRGSRFPPTLLRHREGTTRGQKKMGGKPFMIHMGLSEPQKIISYWEGRIDDEPDYSQPSISFFPEGEGHPKWSKQKTFKASSQDVGAEPVGSLSKNLSWAKKGAMDAISSIPRAILPESDIKKQDIRETNPTTKQSPSVNMPPPSKPPFPPKHDIRDKPREIRDIRQKADSGKKKAEVKRTPEVKSHAPHSVPQVLYHVSTSGSEKTLIFSDTKDLFSQMGIKRGPNQPRMEITATTVDKKSVSLTFSQPTTGKPPFDWRLNQTGTPAAKKKDHGINGSDIMRLLENTKFLEILRKGGILE